MATCGPLVKCLLGSATYRRKGLEHGAIEVPTSLDANDVVQPKARVCAGKQLVVAELLSRKPLRESIDAITLQQEEDVTLHVITHVNNWPASPGKLGQIRRATTDDEELHMAIQFTQHGWPKYAQDVPIGLRPLYEARNHLSIAEELLVYDDRIVVPKSMRQEILDRIHDGHPGIVKSRERAKMSVWWPGLSGEISTTNLAARARALRACVCVCKI